MASVLLKAHERHPDDGRRQGWRQALDVAMKIDGAQGRRRIQWVEVEHPLTALSPLNEVNANANEAQNTAVGQCASAYRGWQNWHTKYVDGLQRVLDVQRLVHNWVRSHTDLGKNVISAMTMGYCQRPLSTQEILSLPALYALTF